MNKYTFRITYFYLSKNIAPYTFLFDFKIIKSLQCILELNKKEAKT